jgi:hypothetical protein
VVRPELRLVLLERCQARLSPSRRT